MREKEITKELHGMIISFMMFLVSLIMTFSVIETIVIIGFIGMAITGLLTLYHLIIGSTYEYLLKEDL